MERTTFEAVLKDIRIQAQKTVPEVSKHLTALGHKASEKTVYSWESGRSRPTIDIFLDMCLFYGVTDVLGRFSEIPELSDVISLSEREHIKKYRLLDPYGKEAVDGVLDVESRRCEAERVSAVRKERSQMEAGKLIDFETMIRYSVPGYTMPMSAGAGQEAGQEYPENYTLIKEPPRGTSFIARVSGVSMEPTYQDGDLVFVHSTESISVGKIGTFYMDGKQWIKERGDGVLISHNPEYDPIPMREDIRCQGLVLGVCDESYFE